MIRSPCKDCPKKHLSKDKCISVCNRLKEIQKMDSSIEKWNEGCGIDYTVMYTFNIPPSLISSTS